MTDDKSLEQDLFQQVADIDIELQAFSKSLEWKLPVLARFIEDRVEGAQTSACCFTQHNDYELDHVLELVAKQLWIGEIEPAVDYLIPRMLAGEYSCLQLLDASEELLLRARLLFITDQKVLSAYNRFVGARFNNLKNACVMMVGSGSKLVQAELDRNWLLMTWSSSFTPESHPLRKTGVMLDYLSPYEILSVKQMHAASWWWGLFGSYSLEHDYPECMNGLKDRVGMHNFVREFVLQAGLANRPCQRTSGR